VTIFGIAYPLYGPGFERGIVYLRDQTTDELLKHLEVEAVTAVYVAPNMRIKLAIFEEAVRRGRLTRPDAGPWKGYAVVPLR